MKTWLRLLAIAALIALLIFQFLPDDPPPSFVIISVDTLRSDHLGCYGYDRWGGGPPRGGPPHGER